MNESVCKTCKNALVWKGSLMDGGLECPHCVDLVMDVEACSDFLNDRDVYYASPYQPSNINGGSIQSTSAPNAGVGGPVVIHGGRQSGKTMAICMAAINYVNVDSPGAVVLLLVHNYQMIDYVLRMLENIGASKVQGQDVVTAPMSGGQIHVRNVGSSAGSVGSSWRLRVSKVFLDHTLSRNDIASNGWNYPSNMVV